MSCYCHLTSHFRKMDLDFCGIVADRKCYYYHLSPLSFGKPRREFLWSEDMADACVFLMENRDFKDTYEGSGFGVPKEPIRIQIKNPAKQF